MRRRFRPNFGFTLTELMISIGIALLLMLGINIVFAAASKTVGAGNSLLSSSRDARTVLQTLLNDLNNVVPVPAPGSIAGDAPFFVIFSQHQYAFRNANEQLAAENQDRPYIDHNLFQSPTIFPQFESPVVLLGDRSHRIDQLFFFTRTLGTRQTPGATAQFVSPTTGNEELVILGHALLPTAAAVNNPALLSDAMNWPGPGQGVSTTNTNNYFASDWMLMRQSILLSPNVPIGNNVLVDQERAAAPVLDKLSPLDITTVSDSNHGIYTGLSDMAQTSIAQYGIKMQAFGAYQTPPANPPGDWWDQVASHRFRASPYVLSTGANKITPTSLAACAPDLIRGCSKFIVEYAGNYYTKNPDGTPVDTKDSQGASIPVPDPSGALDFYTTNANGAITKFHGLGPAFADPGNLYRHIRWYGFPRSTTGTVGSVNWDTGDVVPLRDIMSKWGWSPKYADAERFTFAPAQRYNNSQQPKSLPLSTPPLLVNDDYWSGPQQRLDPTNEDVNQRFGSIPAQNYTYVAAWGPDVQYQPFPKLIRITIEIDDHDGRLNQPQRYEFIFEVQK